MLHGFHNGSKIVVAQNESRRFFGHLRTVDAHGNADISIAMGWGIVHAIVGHDYVLVPGLQSPDDAQLLGNGLGGERVVAGNHDGDDAGRLAFGHGLPDFGAGRVNQAGKTEEGQARFHRGGRHVGGQGGQHLGRVGQHPVALRGQDINAPPQLEHAGLLAGAGLLE